MSGSIWDENPDQGHVAPLGPTGPEAAERAHPGADVVVGAELLDEVRRAICRYVVLPSEEAADAVVLWIAATHVQPVLHHAPRLVIKAPEKRCGKSRLLDLVYALCARPLVTVNATPAAVFRSIGDDHPPTLLVDEADAIFGSRKAAEAHEDLRALINAGHARNRPAIRWDPKARQLERCATFAMAALAGIGDMPDTVEDRAVIVRMRRRAPGEHVEAFRHRRDELPLAGLRDDLDGWLRGHLEEIGAAEPALPVEDRAADTWEPLVTVADLAGGHWPARARKAATVLVGEATEAEGDASIGVRLIGDVRDVFAEMSTPVVASEELVRRLRLIAESPWEAFSLDVRGLSRRLRGYGVRPTRIRPDGGAQVRGYRLEDLADAIARYAPPDHAGEASPSVTPSNVQVNPVTVPAPVTVPTVTSTQTVTGLTCGNDAETDCDGPDGGMRDEVAADLDRAEQLARDVLGATRVDHRSDEQREQDRRSDVALGRRSA